MIETRGAETRGGCIPPIILKWSASERWMMFGPFFGLHVISGKTTVQFAVKIFFFGLHLIYLS